MASKGYSPNVLKFKSAEAVKKSIIAEQEKEIKDLYKKWADDIAAKSKQFDAVDPQHLQLRALSRSLEAQSEEISNEIKGITERNMYTVAEAVIKDNTTWLGIYGIKESPMSTAFVSVQNDIVKNITNGNIYESGWSLSKRIWSDNETTLKDIHQIIAAGVAKNDTLFDIASNLEKYVNPSKRLPWNFESPDGRKIYKRKIDYNAQRLARTLVQHSYQQSFVRTTERNPLISSYRWISNGSRVCPICLEMDGTIFAKDELPMDHPNGMCTMEAIIVDGYEDILADWLSSPDGTNPEMDSFASEFGYVKPTPAAPTVTTKPTIPDNVSPQHKFLIEHVFGTSAKNVTEWKSQMWSAGKFDLVDQFDKQAAAEGLPGYKYFSKYKNKTIDYVVGAKKVDQAVVVDQVGNVPPPKQWMKKFITKADFKKFTAEERAVFAKMKDEQIKALIEYTGNGYTEMNGFLRRVGNGESIESVRKIYGEDVWRYIQNATKAFDESDGLATDMVFRRGGNFGDIAGPFFGGEDYRAKKAELANLSPEELDKMLVGKPGTYTGFTSTSSLKNKGFRNTVETIFYAPKGTKALSITNISQFGDTEAEVLLAPGTKVRVVKVEKGEWGKGLVRMFVEILP